MNGTNATAERLLIVDENESILVVDRELVEKVDMQRGSSSRPEYLQTLIDRQLRYESPEPYVSRDEFLQFATAMKSLLTSFLEFGISYNPHLTGEDGPGSDIGEHLEALVPGTLTED